MNLQNSAYTKKDVDKIPGKGWVWFGDNDVFGKDAWTIIRQNRRWFNTLSVTKNETQGFNTEATFKGQKALTFMKRMGYEFKPVLYKYHYDVTTTYYPDAMIYPVTQVDDNSVIDKVLKSRYIYKNRFVKSSVTIPNSDYLPCKLESGLVGGFSPVYYYRFQTWNIRKDIYGDYPYNEILERMQWVDKVVPWENILEEYWKKKLK